MNKGLEALQRLKEHLDYDTYYQYTNKEDISIIETELKRIDYLERVNKDLQESKDKLIEERNNKIIEHRIVYDDYNFQSIKKFVACKNCQYYENEKCSNTTGCFWLDLERKLKPLEIIKERKVDIQLLIDSKNLNEYNWCVHTKDRALTQEEFDLLKEVLK